MGPFYVISNAIHHFLSILGYNPTIYRLLISKINEDNFHMDFAFLLSLFRSIRISMQALLLV